MQVLVFFTQTVGVAIFAILPDVMMGIVVYDCVKQCETDRLRPQSV